MWSPTRSLGSWPWTHDLTSRPELRSRVRHLTEPSRYHLLFSETSMNMTKNFSIQRKHHRIYLTLVWISHWRTEVHKHNMVKTIGEIISGGCKSLASLKYLQISMGPNCPQKQDIPIKCLVWFLTPFYFKSILWELCYIYYLTSGSYLTMYPTLFLFRLQKCLWCHINVAGHTASANFSGFFSCS